METAGKLVFVLGLMLIVFAGCIGAPAEEYVTEGETTPITAGEGEAPPTVEPPSPFCSSSYEFSELPAKGVIGEVVQFSVTSTCASGKTVTLNIDSKKETGGLIATNDPVTFNFVLMPEVEGTKELIVWVDDEAVYSESWEVLPIGSTDTSGNKNDPASVKDYVATSFELENSITVRSVGAYMRLLYGQTQTLEGSEIVVDIRRDDGGNPASDYIALSQRPINDATMTNNWIYFNFEDGVTLSPGKYWAVFRVTQESQDQIVSDIVNIHYTFGGDTTVPGNEYTRHMNLDWSSQERRFVKTEWKPLAYERAYAIVISGKEH